MWICVERSMMSLSDSTMGASTFKSWFKGIPSFEVEEWISSMKSFFRFACFFVLRRGNLERLGKISSVIDSKDRDGYKTSLFFFCFFIIFLFSLLNWSDERNRFLLLSLNLFYVWEPDLGLAEFWAFANVAYAVVSYQVICL